MWEMRRGRQGGVGVGTAGARRVPAGGGEYFRHLYCVFSGFRKNERKVKKKKEKKIFGEVF